MMKIRKPRSPISKYKPKNPVKKYTKPYKQAIRKTSPESFLTSLKKLFGLKWS